MRVGPGSRTVASLSAAAAMLLLAACSATVAQSGAPGGDTTAAPTTTRAPATTTAVTAAPTTAARPTTTAARPTTTAAPTTTVAPTTTLPATTTTMVSPAIVAVGAPEAGFVPVGTHSGSDTARIQQRLLDLGFWLSAVDGDYGTTTSQAVMAFQKYSGLDPSGHVNEETADALTNSRFRAHGRADAGTLVEIDKDLQLIFVVQDGHTAWVFNTSTGGGYSYTWTDPKKPGELQTDVAITRNGLHAIYRQHDEGWWEGDLGKIYRPKYFSGGEAIHGFNNVPNYPASHGCVRVSLPAMDFIWAANLLPIGIPVWVHGADGPA